MEYDYTPRGVCSRNIHVEVEDGIVKNVIFTGGCSGNTQGVAALAKGMKVDEVIERKKGAKLGIYANKVADNIARYMVPQECGAKEEVRWAKVTDRKGRGMLFEMDENNGPMMFSALPYTPHEMENAMHPYELPEVHYTVVRVAKDQMGIGGDDSWGARTHEEYLLETDKKMEFSFVFKGL